MKFLKVFVFLLICFSFFQTVLAQKVNTGQTGQNLNQYQQNSSLNNTSSNSFKINSDAPELLNQFNAQSTQMKIFPIEKAIDPKMYIVGPNDVFTLGLFGYLNQSVPLTVNLEGSLVIPTVGEVFVDGLTLAEVKKRVISAVKKRYIQSEVSLTITNPRTFLIPVMSSTQKTIEVTPLTRTSDIINGVFYDTLNISKLKFRVENSNDIFVPEISLRNIEIIRKGGETLNVDLYKYYSKKEEESNPYFREGDLLKIPFGILDKNYITINGAVQLGGVYEYNKSDNLETAVMLARGFDNDAALDSITVFRINPATSKFEEINLHYPDDKAFKINLFDRIFVKYKSNYIKNISVIVLGEVVRPGIYPITFKNTTLKEVIDMAGGFKTSASLPLSIIFRKYDEEYLKRDTAEIFLNIRANDLIVKEQDRTNFDIDVLSRRNRVVIDFEKLYKENDMSQNILLENKDIIYINDDKKIVYVYGQVLNEGYVPFREGEDYNYYIKKAGGYSLAADESNTRVIRFNSRGWYIASETSVHSGDFIYVPKDVKTSFSENITLVATIIGTIVSIISTYLLIKSTNN